MSKKIELDAKLIIIVVLTLVIGLMLGYILFSNKGASQKAGFVSSDDKVAKEYKQKEVKELVVRNAKELQKCYFAHLENNPEIKEGSITVLLTVADNGLITDVHTTQNEFKSDKIADCSEDILEDKYLAPPPYGINRNIDYILNFLDEKTAQKQAQERAKENTPPKVLPVK